MRENFTLGRIAGIRIGVNWSVLVIFVIIASGLAEGRLPQTHPGHAWPVYWAAGLATAVVFFASLLAHELAHSIVARRNGMEVEGIVLWLLGGVARLKAEAPTPAAELRIAGVGPLVSLVLGALFTLAAWLLDLTGAPGLAVEAVSWLAGINILLAIFNAIPAAPLDGGRLLRAFLWWRTGDRLRAAAGATAAGRGLGWLLMVVGVYVLVLGDAFGGLWLALIGWFLVAAATEEGRQAQLRSVLAGVPVWQAMTRDPVTAPAGPPVTELLSGPAFRYRHSAFPVVEDDGEPVGLVTLDQVRRVPLEQRGTTAVREAMLPLSEATVVAPDEPLVDLLPRMESGAEHRVLVLDKGRLVGIISPSDISRTVAWLMSTAPQRRGRWAP